MYWVQSIDNGPRRVNHAAASIDHFIYSFGGYSNTEDYSTLTAIDVHRFNTKTLKWCELAKPSRNERGYQSTPHSRYGHTVVVHQRKFYLWGGRNDHNGACNRLFSFDPETRQWSIVSVRGDFTPSARDGHSACLIDEKMFIFGGFEDDNQQYSNELFYFDFSDRAWHLHRGKDNEQVPQWRDFHSATNLNGQMYVFGGRYDRIGPLQTPENIYDNRLYSFNPDSERWSIVPCRGEIPCGRRSHSAFVYDDKLYIFGGYNNLLGRHFNDFYQFDPMTLIWRQVRVHGLAGPIPRRRQCCLVIGHQMFLYGGTSPIASLASTNGNNITLHENFDPNQVRLYDQSDLHILDFSTTLKVLCLLKLAKMKCKVTSIPKQFHVDYQLLIQSNCRNQRSNPETSG